MIPSVQNYYSNTSFQGHLITDIHKGEKLYECLKKSPMVRQGEKSYDLSILLEGGKRYIKKGLTTEVVGEDMLRIDVYPLGSINKKSMTVPGNPLFKIKGFVSDALHSLKKFNANQIPELHKELNAGQYDNFYRFANDLPASEGNINARKGILKDLYKDFLNGEKNILSENPSNPVFYMEKKVNDSHMYYEGSLEKLKNDFNKYFLSKFES